MTEVHSIHELSNGIRLIHKQSSSHIAHCGIVIDTGSRDENPDEQGIAHLIEHVFFKGTGKRKAYHILSRLDDVGGELNAYTTKEETCIHASFFTSDYGRAFELISDIVFNSVFPENEIEKEKEVVIDEINSYKDSPAEQIFDDFEDLIFRGSLLGRPILGDKKTIARISRSDILQFIARNYATDRMVLSSVGNISHKRAIKLFEKFFGLFPSKPNTVKRPQTNGYVPKQIVKNAGTHQTHAVVGNVAYDMHNAKRFSLHILNNLLAGPSLNSRLNLLLREKHALAYNVESAYTNYTDTGAFLLYFGTDKEDLNKCYGYIFKAFDEFCCKKLGTMQLRKAKKQVLGQIAIASESNEGMMLGMAKALLYYNRYPDFNETNRKIEEVSASDLLEVANEILKREQLSSISYT